LANEWTRTTLSDNKPEDTNQIRAIPKNRNVKSLILTGQRKHVIKHVVTINI